ncbi:MAG: hypothetical protein ACR2L2_11405 [Acidobacteriota bacterium]
MSITIADWRQPYAVCRMPQAGAAYCRLPTLVAATPRGLCGEAAFHCTAKRH